MIDGDRADVGGDPGEAKELMSQDNTVGLGGQSGVMVMSGRCGARVLED